MYRLSKFDQTTDRGAGFDGALAKRITPVATARLASAADLMATGVQLAIPRLEGVPLEYLYSTDDSASVALARTLVELDLAAPEGWEAAHRDPGMYVLKTIERWISVVALGVTVADRCRNAAISSKNAREIHASSSVGSWATTGPHLRGNEG